MSRIPPPKLASPTASSAKPGFSSPVAKKTPATPTGSSAAMKPSVLSSVTPKSAKPASDPADATAHRRRLSVMRAPGHSLEVIDGNDAVTTANNLASTFDDKLTTKPKAGSRPVFKRYSVRSKVGYMEFNPSKVNQDRPLEVPKVGREDRSLFGVFDGHGVNGHHVSEYLVEKMTKYFMEHPDLDEDTVEAITQVFAKTSDSLQKRCVSFACTIFNNYFIFIYFSTMPLILVLLIALSLVLLVL